VVPLSSVDIDGWVEDCHNLLVLGPSGAWLWGLFFRAEVCCERITDDGVTGASRESAVCDSVTTACCDFLIASCFFALECRGGFRMDPCCPELIDEDRVIGGRLDVPVCCFFVAADSP
jgi:hypothetical protein